MKPFVENLGSACQALEHLCSVAPAHHYCVAATGADKIEVAAFARHNDLSRIYMNEVDDIVDSMFEDVADLNYAAYETKGRILDEESRTNNPLRQALISQVVAAGTLRWVDNYGDPYRDENLYGEESSINQRDRNKQIASSQQATAGMAFLATCAVVTAARSPKVSATVVKSLPRLSKWFRASAQRIPIKKGVATGTAYAVSAAGPTNILVYRAGAAAALTPLEIPPSPAHMVRFGDVEDISMVTSDMQAAWAQRDAELFNDVFSTIVSLGPIFTVGELGLRHGDEFAKKLAERLANMKTLSVSTQTAKGAELAAKAALTAGKGSKILRFFRITPASFMVGLAVEETVDESLKAARLRRLEKQLSTVSEDNITAVMNELFQVFAGKNHSTRTMMNFVRELERFAALDKKIGEGARLNLARTNLNVYFDENNRPDLTGAHFLSKALCKTYDLIPAPALLPRLTEEQKKEIEFREVTYMGGLSWQFLERLKKELWSYEKALKEYQEYLTKMAKTYPRVATQIEGRIQSIVRWRNEAQQFTQDYQLPTFWGEALKPAPNNFAHDKIREALFQVFTIEWKLQNPQFHAIYRCEG